MQMFMWARPNRPYRDGSMDGDVIAHEYGHGVSNRLVPGTLSGATDQAGSLGEGWSDTISFLRWGDATVGEYVTGDNTGGIRTSTTTSIPDRTATTAPPSTSPHRNGEIWAATMYDIRVAARDPRSTTQLVLDGMRSTVNGPSPDLPRRARRHPGQRPGRQRRGQPLCPVGGLRRPRHGHRAVSNGLHAVPTEDFTVPAELPADR